MRVPCAGWQVSNGIRDGSSLEASAGRKCVLCAVCGVGIAMFLMMLRVLLCSHQDAYEAYCCRGIGLK